MHCEAFEAEENPLEDGGLTALHKRDTEIFIFFFSNFSPTHVNGWRGR